MKYEHLRIGIQSNILTIIVQFLPNPHGLASFKRENSKLPYIDVERGKVSYQELVLKVAPAFSVI